MATAAKVEESSNAAPWDEEQCKAALASLESLQEQLDGLRGTIPQMLDPMNTQHSSHAALFRAFSQALVGSQNNMKAFKNQWHSPEVQSVFEHTRESYAANSDLKDSANVPRYGWVKATGTDKHGRRQNQKGANKEEGSDIITEEDVTAILEDWKKAHPKIKATSEDENQTLLVQLLVGPEVLKFRVAIDKEANGKHRLNAECLGQTKLHSAISRCIASRPKTHDLRYLLDMIAAYKTTRGNCVKCSLLLDEAALMPAARRSKSAEGAEGGAGVVWEPFHEGCLR